MGLSIAISGAIIMATFLVVFLTIPNIVNSIFTLGDVSSEVTKLDTSISKTEISMEKLEVSVGSPRINFTLINEGREKLWNFENFDIIIQYDEGSGRSTESLSFNGDCLGGSPPGGNWCIEIISGDIIDPGIINGGEDALIRTQVSQSLTSLNTLVSVTTDNGVSSIIPINSISDIATGVDPPVACQSGFYGRTFHDTDTGISYYCDPTRDKWLSFETITLWGDEGATAGCVNGQDPGDDLNCNVDWGNGLGPDANQELGLYIPYNITVIGYSFSTDNDTCAASLDVEIWSTGSNSDDNNYSLEAEVATGLTGEAHNANNLDSDIAGDQYILWGIDNNCGSGTVDDWNVIIYFKWRHDSP